LPGVNTCGNETVLDEELRIVMAAPLTSETFDKSTVNDWLALWIELVLLNSCVNARPDMQVMKNARLISFVVVVCLLFRIAL